MADSYQIENILVAQKDKIIRTINDGNLVAAYAMLSVLTPLWENCHYGYKVKEIEKRLQDKSRELLTSK